MLPLVSFIVPVRNDAKRLERCLASILRADYPHDRLEIVVADNGSTDGSDEVARAAGAIVLSLPRLRVAEMRNRAVAASRGAIVAFVDADHEIDPAWTRSAVETLARPGVGATGAPCYAPHAGTWVQARYDGLRRRHEGLREVEWLGSGNLAVRREAFETVGGFDTSLHTCEDVALCQRLRGSGVRIVSDSRMKNIHFGDPATIGALFKGELWRGRDNFRVSIRPPLSPRTLVSLAIPMIELGLLALAIVAPVALAPYGVRVALAALLGVAALVGFQSMRMLQASPAASLAEVLQTVAVAGVYGLARALSLVVRVPHALRHRETS